jgi:hypothetical protein
MRRVGRAADDLDDWQRKFKIENGRLVCVNENKQNSSLYHFVPPPPSQASHRPLRRKAPVSHDQRKTIVIPSSRLWQPLRELVSPPPVPPQSTSHRPNSQAQKRPPAPLPGGYTLASQLRDDPDPEYQVVDVQSDNEFLNGIEEDAPLTSHAIDNRPAPSTIYNNEIQLKNLRERAEIVVAEAMETPSDKSQVGKLGDKGRGRDEPLSPVERVLRELSIKAVPADDSRSSTSAESQQNGKGKVELRGGSVGARFPRRVVALSHAFEREMEKEGFDGVIHLEEEAVAMGELISWLSRDIDFEVTIGISQILTTLIEKTTKRFCAWRKCTRFPDWKKTSSYPPCNASLTCSLI